MMATCSFFGFCVVISFLWHLCFLPTSPAALQSKSACGSFIIYPDCASAVLCLPMDTAKCVLTTALQWKQTMVFIFISGLCDLGKPLYLSQLHCPVCVNTCSIVWAGAGGAKFRISAHLCSARRDWWLLAASLARDTDIQSHKRETHSWKTLH